MRPLRPALLALLALAAAPLGAQSAPPSSAASAAEQVVRDAFAALDERRWRDAVALVDTATVRRFREMRLAMLRQLYDEGGARRRSITDDTTMPAAVREWMVEREREARAQIAEHDVLSSQFAGVDSLAQAERMPAAELLARHFEAQLSPAPGGRPFAPLPVALRRHVVGGVASGDTAAHVLYATSPPRGVVRSTVLHVATVRRTPDGWRIWSIEHDNQLSLGGIGGAVFGQAFVQWAEEQRVRRVTWPRPGQPEAVASLGGYTGGVEPPASLVIELPRRDGPPVRVEIPREKFRELMELLTPWAYW